MRCRAWMSSVTGRGSSRREARLSLSKAASETMHSRDRVYVADAACCAGDAAAAPVPGARVPLDFVTRATVRRRPARAALRCAARGLAEDPFLRLLISVLWTIVLVHV